VVKSEFFIKKQIFLTYFWGEMEGRFVERSDTLQRKRVIKRRKSEQDEVSELGLFIR